MSEQNSDWERETNLDAQRYQHGKTIAREMESQGITDHASFESSAFIDDLSQDELRAESISFATR